MNNLLYLSRERGSCAHCGGHAYVSAVYLDQSVTGWHLMIETQCEDCTRLDTTDWPLSEITELTAKLEAQAVQDLESERATAEESGIAHYDNLGFEIGKRQPSDPSEI